MHPSILCYSVFFVSLFAWASAQVASEPASNHKHLWLEGEAFFIEQVDHQTWYHSADKQLLSGGDFISHMGEKPGLVSYQFQNTTAGEYFFWLRLNPFETLARYRLNGTGDWRVIDLNQAFDKVHIGSEKETDMRGMAWVGLGAHALKEGTNRLLIELRGVGEKQHGAIDCYCFTTDPFYRPEKLLKPGDPRPVYSVPTIEANNFDQWMTFVEPSPLELKWAQVRWHDSLSGAAAEAASLNRPILLWTMNGHPCGET